MLSDPVIIYKLSFAKNRMDNVRAYGAGLAGGQFDASGFMRKPTVIFRSIALVGKNPSVTE
ncbi:hypothetical protein DICVIV_11756 [Dictyocaulus viviparus]|uniref:Uncharacterized protein n=1 Tax=Dictyocaulus viviparus TaxID=29172 RepID=A0A0D8XCC6_DICVI|nr:hypothetical protein DICVIV_11756 [Dictyocaulus viviparus]